MHRKEELHIEEKSGYLWIVLPDAITMYNNREIEEMIGNRLRDRQDHVVLDFTGTQTVYSSGLGLMIRIRRFVSERNGILSLVNVSEQLFAMFAALNIDKVFNIYATDVEFEISQDDFLNKKNTDKGIGFLFVTKIENGVMHINISGEMSRSFELATCKNFEPPPGISLYLVDLSALESVDSDGAVALLAMTKKITGSGGTCRAFGVPEIKREMLMILGADVHLAFYPDQQSAFEGHCPIL